MSEVKKYNAIFDRLSSAQLPSEPESTVVFGRNDAKVAHKAGQLVIARLAPNVVITGGFGKDSGDLAARGYSSEAEYLASELNKFTAEHGVRAARVLLDEEATNGGENARNSLAILRTHDLSRDNLTAVAHATSSVRLGETLRHEMITSGNADAQVFVVPSSYEFSAENPADRAEARDELLRLADWPEKGWLQPQDLDEEMVAFARDEKAKETNA